MPMILSFRRKLKARWSSFSNRASISSEVTHTHGFTLLEMIVVITIIGLLAMMVVPGIMR